MILSIDGIHRCKESVSVAVKNEVGYSIQSSLWGFVHRSFLLGKATKSSTASNANPGEYRYTTSETWCLMYIELQYRTVCRMLRENRLALFASRQSRAFMMHYSRSVCL